MACGALLLIAAAERPAPRLAVVDADRIRRESSYVQGKLIQISQPAEQIKEQLIAKREKLRQDLEDYQAQSTAMSDEARRQKAVRLQQLSDEVSALSRRFDDALGKAGGQELEFVRLQIMQVVGGLAAERELDAVFSSANVLYTGPQVDLTDEVIRRLDATRN
jgi:Skp family chaperone for outer membrane proteins